MFAEELRAIDARLDELAREREILLARRFVLLDADLGTLYW
ncbi:hypothetical protein Sbal678_0055 [Shewanella baltica OS678]|nr:hypothetical protein Sbal678_0055 [Shewanella baltica OS678]